MDPWRVPRHFPPTLPPPSARCLLATPPIREEADEAGRILNLAADAFLREIETRSANPLRTVETVAARPTALATRERLRPGP